MAAEPKTLEITYKVVNVRAEAKEPAPSNKHLISIELFDETSTPQTGMIKRAIIWLHEDDYKALGSKTPPDKVTITIR